MKPDDNKKTTVEHEVGRVFIILYQFLSFILVSRFFFLMFCKLMDIPPYKLPANSLSLTDLQENTNL